MENNKTEGAVSKVLSDFENLQYVRSFNEEFNKRVLTVSVTFGLTACLGLVANVLVVYVYGIKYKRCNFKYFLFVLGLIGVVQCLIMLPIQVAEMHYWFMFPTSWLCRVSAYVFGYTVINCYFVLLLIALDRFRKVCRPYNWQIQPNTARNLCVVVSVASLVFATPPGIISGHHKFVTSYDDVNITVTVCSTDDIFNDREWAVYFLLMFGGIPVTIVIIVTCVLYGIILKQFYQGHAFALKSLYSNSTSGIPIEKRSDKNGNPLALSNNSITNSNNQLDIPGSPQDTPKSDKKFRPKPLQKLISSVISTRDSIRSTVSTSSGPLRSSGSQITKREVRRKLMRKTFIVLIITVTCIIALIITFCLHLVAEHINNNVRSISTATLVAFVIFHRGSFSIICAIFPVIYGLRDPKFREAAISLIGRFKRNSQEVNFQDKTIDESKC